MPAYAATSAEILEKMRAGWTLSSWGSRPFYELVAPITGKSRGRRIVHQGSVAALLRSGKLVRTGSGAKLGEEKNDKR